MNRKGLCDLRKVKFSERDSKAKRSFMVHGQKETLPSLTKPPNKPIVSSPPLSAIRSASLVQCSSTSIYDDLPDDKENKREHKKGYLGRKLTPPVYDSPEKRGERERRISLTLPKEKKAPLILSSSSSPRERRHSISDRRHSITSQAGGKGVGSETGGLSCTSSQASYGDDFVDNLTKLKLNLQLKNVTDRMFEVLNEYDKHNEENPNHNRFDKAGEKMSELDDMELKGNILSLITDYKDTCVEREKILSSLSNWFSKEHMQNFMKVINERQLSDELLPRRSKILETSSSNQLIRRSVIDYLKLEDIRVPVSSSSEQQKEPAGSEEDEEEDSWKKSTNKMEEAVSEPQLPEHTRLQMEAMALAKDGIMSKGIVEGKWTQSSEKLCELLRWARSEGFVDLITLNDFLETMTDLTELFKSLKSDLEQQKQVGVMSEMTIIKLTEENEHLSKDVHKFEVQMSEARNTIRKITKQLKALQIASCSKHFTKNQMVQVEITSNQPLRNLIGRNESIVKELNVKVAELQMENTDLKTSYEELKDQHETATEMFEREIEDYKEEVKKIIAAIVPQVGSVESLLDPDPSTSQVSLMGIRSSLIQIVDSRARRVNSGPSKRSLHSQLSEAPPLSPTLSGRREKTGFSPQEESTELREDEEAHEYHDTGEMFSKPPPPRVPRPSLAGDIVPSVKPERQFSVSAGDGDEPQDETLPETQFASMPTGASSMPKKDSEKIKIAYKDSQQDSGMPENISEYVVPGHALLPQSRPDVAPHGKQQLPSSLINRRFTLPVNNIPTSSRSHSVMSGQSQNAESDHASNIVSSTSNMPSEASKSGRLTADEWMNKEVKYKKRLSAAMASNAKTKLELLEKEKELRFAEHEISTLKKQVREMEHLVAENELKWRSSARGEVTVSEGTEKFSQSSTSPAGTEASFKSKRGLVVHRKLKPDSVTRPKKVILKPGMVMTNTNIDNIVMPNSDEENMKLVKDLLKQMRLESSRLVTDTRARSRALCDLKNVCNVVAHVKNKLQAKAEKNEESNTQQVKARAEKNEESNSDHLQQECEVDSIHVKQETSGSQSQREREETSSVRNFTEHNISKSTFEPEGGSYDPDFTKRSLSAELDFNARMKRLLKRQDTQEGEAERLLKRSNTAIRGARKFNRRKDWSRDNSGETCTSAVKSDRLSAKASKPGNEGSICPSSSSFNLGILGQSSKLQIRRSSSQNEVDHKEPVKKSLIRTSNFKDAAADAYNPKTTARSHNLDTTKSGDGSVSLTFHKKDWIGSEAEVGYYEAHEPGTQDLGRVDSPEATGHKEEQNMRLNNSSTPELGPVDVDDSTRSSGNKAFFKAHNSSPVQELDPNIASSGSEAEMRRSKAHTQELDTSVGSSGNKAEMGCYDSSTQELDPTSLVQSVLALVDSNEGDPGSASDAVFLSNIQDKLENIYASLSKLPNKKNTSIVFHLDQAKPRRPSMTINALSVPFGVDPESRSQSSEESGRLYSRRNTYPEGVEIILSNPSKSTVNTELPGALDYDILPPVTPPRQRRRRQSMPANIFLASEYRDRIADLKHYMKSVNELESGPPFRRSYRAQSISGDNSTSDSLTITSLPPEEILMGTQRHDRRRSLQLHYKPQSAISNLSAGIRNSHPPPPGKLPLALEVLKLYTKPRPTQEKPPTVEKMKPFKRGSIEDRISVSGNYISPPVEALHFASRTGMYCTTGKEVEPQ